MTGTRVAPDHARHEADTLCEQCGAELADDQEWCLECGGARTLIHRGPDWRVPLVVIATVIVLAIGGFRGGGHQPLERLERTHSRGDQRECRKAADQRHDHHRR